MSYSEWRYLVTVKTLSGQRPFVRTVSIDGPNPDKAVIKVLAEIAKDEDNDMWQSDDMSIRVERVR